jgi:hypothetical protein
MVNVKNKCSHLQCTEILLLKLFPEMVALQINQPGLSLLSLFLFPALCVFISHDEKEGDVIFCSFKKTLPNAHHHTNAPYLTTAGDLKFEIDSAFKESQSPRFTIYSLMG